MPIGFGFGPFGQTRFGSSAWALERFQRGLTDFQRQQDDLQDQRLQRLLDAWGPVFERQRVLITDFGSLREALTVRTQYNGELLLRLGRVLEPLTEPLQRGLDGTFSALGEFVSSTVRLKADDRGKRVVVVDAGLVDNRRTFRIASVITPNRAILDPVPSTDTSTFSWELRALDSLEPGQVVVEVQEGDVDTIARQWTLSTGRRVYPVLSRAQFQRPVRERRVYTEREGTDGAITAFGLFSMARSVLTAANVGQLLSIQSAANKGVYRIVSIQGTTAPQSIQLGDTATGELFLLTPDAGPFHWALFPRALILLEATGAPAGTVEQQENDLQITTPGLTPTVLSSRMRLVVGRDEGKILRLVSLTQAANRTLLRVDTINTSTEAVCTVLGTAPVATLAESNLYWELRDYTVEGDTSQVLAQPQPLIELLAADIGLVIDEQDTEEIQRDYVLYAPLWFGLKGHAKGYSGLGGILGFDVVAEGLYRIDEAVRAVLPDDTEVVVYETDTGRMGDSGTLALVGSIVQFSDPDALFTAGDETRSVVISGAAVGGNNKTYTIEQYVSPTTVRMRPTDTVTLPDGNNGALDWQIARYYTTRAPLLPRFDEVNTDQLWETIAAQAPGTDFFALDTYCWEDNFSTTIKVDITAVTQLAPDVWEVEITGDANVCSGVGNWALEDHLGDVFFLETVPVLVSPGVYTANVQATAAPAITPGGFDALQYYVCQPEIRCDFCPASKVRLTISPRPVVGSTPAMVERYKERLLSKLRDVTPSHVEIVPFWTVELTAPVPITPTIEVP